MNSSDGITLLYEHPHISIHVTDNTEYVEEEVAVEEKSLNGIQVGFFGSGRDNKLLYLRSTGELINEFGDLNYKLYGQSGYNAYNALDSGAGMYVMRLMPDNATYANTVIMAKYKLVDDTSITPPVIGDSIMELIGTNPIKEMIPDENNTAGNNTMAVFTLSGKVVSGLTGDTNIDSLFSHITPEWLEGNNLGNFSVATLKIPVPSGVIVGENITIQQTSAALKKFYADFGIDAEHITANVDDVTATKQRTYSAETLLEGNDYVSLSVLVAENDTIYLDVTWEDGGDAESIAIKTSQLTFIQPDEVEEETISQKLGIKYEAVTIPNATTITKLRAEIAKLYGDEPDENGFYNVPIMAFWALGRGSYGQNIRIKISDANSYDGTIEPTTRTYRIGVMEATRKGLTEYEYAYGMLDEEAFVDTYENGPSLYLPDIVNDVEQGSGKINMYVNTIAIQNMIDMVNETIDDPDEQENISIFDPIMGLTVTGMESNHVIILTDNQEEEGYVNLLSPNGFGLFSGDDGDFDTEKHTEQEINDVKEELLNQAFAGTIDKRIRSRYATPADFCFDAAFPDGVKVSMAAFAKNRQYDCMTYLDCKLYKTAQECIEYLKSMTNLTGNNIVKEMHCYKYRDTKFTKKICEMSITHWFSKALPTHILRYGVGEPFAKDRAIIANTTDITKTSDFIADSFLPVIDPDEHTIKAQILKYGGNCFETVKYNTYQRSSAFTTYEKNSDRKDEFNEFITQRAIKIAHDLLNSKIYKISEEEQRNRYTQEAERIISVNLAGLVRTCSVKFEMTKADERKGILRLILRLTFYTVSKYGVCEVVLDPRVVSEAAA